jgi:protein gp37
MVSTKIEWTESTWNPITGCTKISSGCKFCYAEVMSRRLKAMGQEKYKNGFELTIHPDVLNEPYTWKKGRMIFVNSMSDLFHKDLPISYIQQIFKVIKENPQHVFQVLTKRADILRFIGIMKWVVTQLISNRPPIIELNLTNTIRLWKVTQK